MKSFRLVALSLLLVACGGNTPVQEQPLTLSAVLPSPVTPGDPVVAYGRLPAGTPATLDGVALTGTAVPGGLQFTVPTASVAGVHVLHLGTGALNGSVQVIPRIDGAEVVAGRLRVWGAGWDVGDVSLEVNGVATETGAQGPDLTAPVSRPGVYGSLNLRVLSKGFASAPYALRREAASMSGAVTLPGAASPKALALSPRNPPVFRSLLVRGTFSAPRNGLMRSSFLPALGLTRLTYATPGQAVQAQQHLLGDPDVQSVEGDDVVQSDGTRVRPLDATPTRAAQWFWPLEGFSSAWNAHLGEGVTVAVVDTGVLLNHPDFQGRLLPGLDLVDNDTDPTDTDGHGTHVAGLIAANGALTGAAPGAQLLPVRVLNGEDGGSVADVASGILWAADLLPDHPNPHPAQVINLSLGTDEYSPVLADAVKAVQAKGVLVVAATGNDGGRPLYPAALPDVIAVTALAGPQVSYQPSYANRGAGTAITAYGGDLGADQNHDGVADGILSTDLVQGKPGYAMRMGTSMAAPQVSGALALALSGGANPALLRASLLHRSVDLGVKGLDDTYGWGLLNADVARVSDPRVYALALRADGSVVSFSPVVDGKYQLGNLPPAETLQLVALSDGNNDGLLGEAGDLRSIPRALTLQAGQASSADLTLAPTDGRSSLRLKGTP